MIKGSSKRNLILFLLLILLFLFTGVYLYLYYQNGGICFRDPVCTKEVKTVCHTPKRQIWQGPSFCSCGLDASTLINRGWIECELPENYQGPIKTGATYSLEIPKIKIPRTLPLFVIPATLLTLGIGTILLLWGRQR